jgi:hypothetical protein
VIDEQDTEKRAIQRKEKKELLLEATDGLEGRCVLI